MNDSPSSDPMAQALEEVASAPATLPLKRPVPVFVEATLPPIAPLSPQDDLAEAPEDLAPIQSDSALPPSDSVTAPSDSVTAPRDSVAAPNDSVTAPSDSVTAPNDLAPSLESVSPLTPLAQETRALPGVEFSPPPGPPVQGSLTLQLVSNPVGSEIRYALNAGDVGAGGLLYDPAQKIFLSQSTSVAARTVSGDELGPLATAEFEIVQPVWHKIEPLDQSDPTPHEIGEQCALEGSWQLAAASTRGKLHAHRGLWREDSLAYGLAPAADGNYAITIVSDGAGSANLSRVGSKLLCNVALGHLQTHLTAFAPLASDDKTLISRDLPLLRTLLVEAAGLALGQLREEAARRARPLGDFSSTLLILVRREWNGAQLCAALQAGDGSIALWDDDDTLTFLGEADHGAHTSETKFLTTSGLEAELPARVKFSIRPRLRAALVMSDGIADDFFPEPVRFPELIGQVLPRVETDALNAGAALLDWMRYEKKGSSDDRALVISWRETAPVVEIESAADATLDALTNVTPAAAPSDAPQPPTIAPEAPFPTPATKLEAPATVSEAPATELRAPATALGAPATALGAPATELGTPATELGTPATELGTPATELGTPATELGTQATESEAPATPQVTDAASQHDTALATATALNGDVEMVQSAPTGGETRDGEQ